MLLIIKVYGNIKKGGKKMFASLLSLLGSLAAINGSKTCPVLFMDEPKMPKCLLNK